MYVLLNLISRAHSWLRLQCGRDGRRHHRLNHCRSGAPAQRHLFGFGNLIAAVVLLDTRLAAEVVAVVGHPLLVAHDNTVQVGPAGLAAVEATIDQPAAGWVDEWSAQAVTKRSFVKNATRDRVNAARLEYTHGTMLGDTTTTRGRVPVKSAISGGRALKQQRWPELRFSGGWTTRG